MTRVPPPESWQLTREQPAVVVAIAHWNRIDLLRLCIAAVREHTPYPHYRIAVFDQGSTDGSVEYIQSLLPDIDVVFSPENVGFTRATNALIDRYPAWDVVLLNNDTRVTAGWLPALVDTASRSEKIGLVGAKLVWTHSVLQAAGGELFADGRVRARGRGESAFDPRFQERRAVDFCSAACLFVKRTVIDRCGPLDTVYEAGYYEDVDLALRARAAGFTVMYEPRAVVFHREHGSYGADVAGTLMRRYRDDLRSRWATSLAQQQASPFEVADDLGRPRLLLVSDVLPGNTLSPRMRRIRQLIRALNGAFHIVYLNCVGQGLDRYAALIEELGATPYWAPLNAGPGMSGLDEEELIRVNYFPLVVCGGPDAALFLRNRFPATALEASTVVVDVGMEVDVVDAANRSGVSHIVAAHDAQRQTLLAADPRARCVVLRPTAEATTSRPLPRAARTDIVLLTDNLDGPAAAAAVGEMIGTVVPALRAQVPHAVVRFGGGPVSPELLANRPARLVMLPSTTPVGSILDRARVVVIPQHWCAPDTLSNVVEARARAIPIVTSSAVAAACGLIDGRDVIAVDTAEALVQQIVRVYTDPWLWPELTDRGTASAARVDDDFTRALTAWGSGHVLVGHSTP